MVTVKEVASLKEGEWSCYRGCQFNGETRSSEGYVYGGCQFNGGRMVMLWRWPV